MIAHHRFKPGNSRHDPFWPAAEPGEKVRLDEAGDDAHIGLDEVPVDERRSAVTSDTHLRQRAAVLRFVIQNPVILHDRRGEQAFQFGASIWPMRPQLVEQRDLFARNIGEIFEQPGD